MRIPLLPIPPAARLGAACLAKPPPFCRRSIFEDNLRYIQQHNFEADLGRHGFRLGMNEFGDLTTAEFRRVMLGLRLNATHTGGATYLPPSNVKLPDTVDWRTKGYVTPVKNQVRRPRFPDRRPAPSAR